MSLNFLKDLEEKMSESSMINGRTEQTIIAELIYNIANDKSISGEHKSASGTFPVHLMKLANAYWHDQDFNQALKTIAVKVLNIFPNEE